MSKTRVNYSCQIKLQTAQGRTLDDQYTGSFELEGEYETDFGGEDVFLIPEVLREAMYNLDERKNEKAGLSNSQLLDFSLTHYTVEHLSE